MSDHTPGSSPDPIEDRLNALADIPEFPGRFRSALARRRIARRTRIAGAVALGAIALLVGVLALPSAPTTPSQPIVDGGRGASLPEPLDLTYPVRPVTIAVAYRLNPDLDIDNLVLPRPLRSHPEASPTTAGLRAEPLLESL